MSTKPIFVATHPRACSTAFERVFSSFPKLRQVRDSLTDKQVFMTRQDVLKTVHEPFGDAFYFGPELLGERYKNDQQGRLESGFINSTYKTIMDRFEREGSEGKRLFIKDIAHYLVPANNKPSSIAPSLLAVKRGVGTDRIDSISTDGIDDDMSEDSSTYDSATNYSSMTSGDNYYPYPTPSEPNNPTVLPTSLLETFHFTFLIRHPHSSVPSYYRCTIPPLDKVTGFYNFRPDETGLNETRRIFDYLRSVGIIGPKIAGRPASPEEEAKTNVEICVVDADDLLDNPAGIIKAYCKTVGLDYSDEMLNWNSKEAHSFAKDAFEKWKGFHEDAIDSQSLKPRDQVKKAAKVKTEAEYDAEWAAKYGVGAAKVIRETVDANVEDYEYLKSFALKPVGN
ncbi:MAG: hypothetical protein M1834_006053 [Cirrosporium novae-zelandiae]|nr:MAG: hypothetical protein M1834_006053 [Cirrosporium novae-zelandiae]